jgi:sugar lactone lactonase YvrE
MTGDSGQLPAEPRRDLPSQDPGSPPRSAASEIRSTPVRASATMGLLTEGPRWHAERGELLWVDILGHTLHRSRPGPDGTLESACDPQGRFWAGTMAYDEAPGAGVLYRLELDGSCTTVLTGLTISNGIGWSPDGATMYLADSGTGLVEAFDFDGATGDLSQRRTLVRIQQPGAVPDGLTVDQEGGIWVALWGGGAVQRYGPDGALLAMLRLPVDQPTSCAFGGPELATLFVTSARAGLDEAALDRQPHAGHLFRFDDLGVTGTPCAPYRGRIDSAATHG